MGRRMRPAPVVVSPEDQPDATIDIANPVSGTLYTVLDTTENVRIINASAIVTWTVQPSPLQIWITIDGQTRQWDQWDPVSDTRYLPAPQLAAVGVMGTGAYTYSRAFLLEGRSVKVEAEITGGTVSRLRARVKWARWP